MKKILLFTMISVCAVSAAQAEYVTPGTGEVFTLKSLSQTEGSGVSAQGRIYTLSEDLTISATDTLQLKGGDELKLGDGVCVTMNGYADFNAVGSAYVTRTDTTAVPEGFYFKGDEAQLAASNVTFEYVGVLYATSKPVSLSHCTFRYVGTALSSTAAFAFASSSVDNKIDGCRFIQNESAAIGGAANYSNGLALTNSYFYDNNTLNTNKPQINLMPGGEGDLLISNNVVIGAQRDMVGGIGISNMYNLAGTNKIIITGNSVNDCRYGIAVLYGTADVTINNNSLVNNHYESNPMNGGSGINIVGYGGTMNVSAQGNYVEGNYWGVTVMYYPTSINFGKNEDPEAEDYNPGNNVFKNNGFNGKTYDFYNYSTTKCYAQGNLWSAAEQDSVSIEDCVYHINDDATLAEVVYMSKEQDVVTSIAPLDATLEGDFRYNAEARTLELSKAASVSVYSLNGVLARTSSIAVSSLDLNTLKPGSYVARNNVNGRVIKFVVD